MTNSLPPSLSLLLALLLFSFLIRLFYAIVYVCLTDLPSVLCMFCFCDPQDEPDEVVTLSLSLMALPFGFNFNVTQVQVEYILLTLTLRP